MLQIEIGSHLPNVQGKPQYVCLATDRGEKHDIILTPAGGPVNVELSGMETGTEIHLVSNGLFSPAWEGQQDRRLLSFWISVKDEVGKLLIPTTG
ncbi:MAG: hypothetical protein ACRD22_05415 [Terriglobia bacterium]